MYILSPYSSLQCIAISISDDIVWAVFCINHKKWYIVPPSRCCTYEPDPWSSFTRFNTSLTIDIKCYTLASARANNTSSSSSLGLPCSIIFKKKLHSSHMETTNRNIKTQLVEMLRIHLCRWLLTVEQLTWARPLEASSSDQRKGTTWYLYQVCIRTICGIQDYF